MKFKHWQQTAWYGQPSMVALSGCGVPWTEKCEPEDEPTPCMVYPADGSYKTYIQRVDHERGIWLLTIGNNSYLDDNLLKLEKILYNYVVDERVFHDRPLTSAQDFDILNYLDNMKGRVQINITPKGTQLTIDENTVYSDDTLRDVIWTAILKESVND